MKNYLMFVTSFIFVSSINAIDITVKLDNQEVFPITLSSQSRTNNCSG